MVAEPISQVFAPALDTPQQDDDWEALVSEAVQVVETDQSNWWRKGHIALRCTRRYGDKSLTKLGKETGLGAYKTLAECAQIVTFFPPSAVAQTPTLLKEHFRVAFRAVKHCDRPIDDPLRAVMGYLKRAEETHQSAAAMGREMKVEFGQPAKERWRYEPDECHTVGEYLAFLLPADALKQIHDDVLVHQGHGDFKMTVSFSYTHQPQGI